MAQFAIESYNFLTIEGNMGNDQKTFRRSPVIAVLSLLILGFFGLFLFFSDVKNYFFSAILIVIFINIFLSFSGSLIISDYEIITCKLGIEKGLKWSEISNISGKGSSIKLQNHDRDVTILIDSQIEGFLEALENNGIRAMYFFRERFFRIDEIKSVQMKRKRGRNGYHYFPSVKLTNGKSIPLSDSKQNAPILYYMFNVWLARNKTQVNINSNMDWFGSE